MRNVPYYCSSNLKSMSNVPGFDAREVGPSIDRILSGSGMEKSRDHLKLVFSLIDLTSLNTEDTSARIKDLCQKVNGFSERYPGIPNVAALCVWPLLVPVARETLRVPGVGIASVAAGFPSSQTYLPVKEMECKLAVDAGATEIDIVISLGRFKENDREYVAEEIRRIKEAIAPARLKVILETGLLSGPEEIYHASMLCLRAGADYIKTSTGKIQPAATHQSVYLMCRAIKDFHAETGNKAGIKPAGGISTAGQALEYASIVRSVLGKHWLDPALFRIGASRLANQILSEIQLLDSGRPEDVSYF